ncbi:hypothetical protein GEMRC1_005300 [Eukaryota sp. GEM-RC1]
MLHFPTGVDDPCCGTFDSPCASFKGVLEIMGRKGKVYFHEGSYSFEQGFGNVSDVDWEIIGLGDVMIEGTGATLLEIQFSNFSLSNVDLRCSSLICFSLSHSTVFLSNSTIFHHSGVSAITHTVTVSSMFMADEFILSENSVIILSTFFLFDFHTVNAVVYAFNSNILLHNNSYKNTSCKSLIESFASNLKVKAVVIFNVSCDICFNITGGNVVVEFMDVSDTSGSLFFIFKVDFMVVHNFGIYDSYMITVIAAQNTTLNLTDVSVFSSELNTVLELKNSSGSCYNLAFSTSIASDLFDLIDTHFTFSNTLLTNTSFAFGYNIQSSKIAISVFTLENIQVSGAFLFSIDSSISIKSFRCESTHLDDSLGLFTLSYGSLIVSTFDVYHLNGTLFDLNNMNSSIDQVHLSHLQSLGGTLFRFVKSNVSVSTISITYTNLNVVFKAEMSNICISQFQSISSRSLSVFDGSSSVYHEQVAPPVENRGRGRPRTRRLTSIGKCCFKLFLDVKVSPTSKVIVCEVCISEKFYECFCNNNFHLSGYEISIWDMSVFEFSPFFIAQ